MPASINYASAAADACIVDVSSSAARGMSAPSNLLEDGEDGPWMAGAAPQHVTLRICDGHRPIRYVGWHVGNDYLTNPKTVVVTSGPGMSDAKGRLRTHVFTCDAEPGAGSQLWDLPEPIDTGDVYVRFDIVSTFGPGPTYMNRLFLYADHPGSAFETKIRPHDSSTASHRGTTSMQMSDLLQGLDEDIRMLHPIRTVSPSRTRPSGQRGGSPSALLQSFDDFSPNQRGPDEAMTRIGALESSLESLLRVVEKQSADIADIRDMVKQQHTKALADSGAAKGAADAESPRSRQRRKETQLIEFPEAALKNYIEDVLAPRLAKHAKRTEARTLQQIDEHMNALMKEISNVVDDRVERHLHRIMTDASHPYRRALRDPYPAGADTSAARNASGSVPQNTSLGGAAGRRAGPSKGASSAEQYNWRDFDERFGHGGSRSRVGPSSGTHH